MAKSVKISIPSPCHAKWEDMTPANSGRFCASCKTKVWDLTNKPDKEIYAILKSNDKICGRLSTDQADRELTLHKEARPRWVAAGMAAITILAAGTADAVAQTPPATEQHAVNKPETTKTSDADTGQKTVTGIVSDENGPVPRAKILNITKATEAAADVDGRYAIDADYKDIIQVVCLGYTAQEFEVGKATNYDIALQGTVIGEIVYVQQRTFFGRIFHSIGNLFR